jgi:hypothetical protein
MNKARIVGTIFGIILIGALASSATAVAKPKPTTTTSTTTTTTTLPPTPTLGIPHVVSQLAPNLACCSPRPYEVFCPPGEIALSAGVNTDDLYGLDTSFYPIVAENGRPVGYHFGVQWTQENQRIYVTCAPIVQ